MSPASTRLLHPARRAPFLFLTAAFFLLPARGALAKRYMSDAEALRRAFPEAAAFSRQERALDGDVRRDVEKRLGRDVPEPRAAFHVARGPNGDVLGWGFFVDEIGKTMPITFLVGVDATGRVTAVELVEFRESRGDGIARASFRRQFVGKTAADPLRLGREIRSVSSSTMSCEATCFAVRKALVLAEALCLNDAPNRPEWETFKKTLFRMGTQMEIRLAAADAAQAERAFSAAFDAIDRVDRLMSHYKPDSDVSRLNRAAGRPVAVAPETAACLRSAVDWWRRTDGAFDPACGALVDLWGFGAGGGAGRVPADAEIAQARAAGGAGEIVFDADGDRIRVRLPPGAQVTLAGIAKGYAADLAAQACRDAAGIRRGVVDVGGTLVLIGAAGAGAPDRIAIRHPRDPARAAGFLRVFDAAVATSGDAERFFEADGRRYAHILDPRTGRPVPWEGSVTVVAPRGADADALSTALYVLGPEKGTALADALDGVAALFLEVRPDGTLARVLSKRMEALYHE